MQLTHDHAPSNRNLLRPGGEDQCAALHARRKGACKHEATRISVELILEWLGSGASRDEIVSTYPHLTVEDIQQATEFAAAFRNDVVVNAKVAL